jgi:hypothetical protein
MRPLDNFAFHNMMSSPLSKPPRRWALVLATGVLVKPEARFRQFHIGSDCAVSGAAINTAAIMKSNKLRFGITTPPWPLPPQNVCSHTGGQAAPDF